MTILATPNLLPPHRLLLVHKLLLLLFLQHIYILYAQYTPTPAALRRRFDLCSFRALSYSNILYTICIGIILFIYNIMLYILMVAMSFRPDSHDDISI